MRHIKLLLGLALAYCLTASPALAAFGYTWKVAALGGSASGTISTTAQTITAGHMILVVGGAGTMPAGTTLLVTDQNVSDTFTTYQCLQTAGSTHAAVISWVITAGLSSQTLSISTNGAGNAAGLYMEVIDVTGMAASSPEDTAARACTDNGGSATTSPTQTSGVPTGAGELFVSPYISNHTNVSFSFTEDSAWTVNHALGGSSNVTFQGARMINAGSGAVTRAPTTTSASYAMPITAFCPSGGSGGCSAPAVINKFMFQPAP